MEITRTNFREKFNLIKSSIDEATFLATDCEFTGLNEAWNLRAFDTPAERFEKIKDGAMQFLVIQFGLCAFKYDKTTENYTHKAFNFYIFPRSFGKHSPDPRFYSQSSSLEFLASQGFDFNKLLKEGIPFLTSKDEEILREKLKTKHAEQEQKYSPAGVANKGKKTETSASVIDKVPKEHEKFIKNIHSKVSNYLNTWEEGKCLTLPTCSAYQRKLIYETVKPVFNTDEVNLNMETLNGENGDKYIKISKETLADAKAKLGERQEKELDELDEALGFTKVIKAISASGKLVIGHNMLLDIMHLVNQFVTPLPDNYEDFKNLTHCVFPNLLDTKVMSTTNPFKEYFSNTALNMLLKRTREKPFTAITVEPEANFDGCYQTTSEQLHEAGYDAFITGLCFLSLSYYLGNLNKSKKKPAKHIFPDDPLIKAFTNKLFMMLSPDIPYLNLGGPDLQPDRSHVFHVSFPREWKTPDIIELFSPCGYSFVSWIDDESAFVSLKNPNNARNAKSLLTSDDYQGAVKILTFEEYKNKKSLNKRKPSDSETINSGKKRKCEEESTKTETEKKSLTTDLGEIVPRLDINEGTENSVIKTKIFAEVDKWS